MSSVGFPSLSDDLETISSVSWGDHSTHLVCFPSLRGLFLFPCVPCLETIIPYIVVTVSGRMLNPVAYYFNLAGRKKHPLHLLTLSHHFLIISLFYGTMRSSRLILYCLFQTESAISPEALVSFIGQWIFRRQNLQVRCTHWLCPNIPSLYYILGLIIFG